MIFDIFRRSLSKSATEYAIKNTVVVGGGLIGSGIVQVAAQAGNNVTLVEINSEILKSAVSQISRNTKRFAEKLYKNKLEDVEKFVHETCTNIKGSTDPEAAVQDADLVIEAIEENLKIKQKFFKTLDAAAPRETIFASSTSSLKIAEISSVTKRQDRFVGLHFFSPVPLMKLVEVVKTEKLTEDTFQKVWSWVESIGKICIKCKDTPGFIANRLFIPYISEALQMLEREDASVQEIDTAMKLGIGFPLGPFELVDFIGLNTAMLVLESWHQRYPQDSRFEPTRTLKKLVEQGKLGRKSGEGFYKY